MLLPGHALHHAMLDRAEHRLAVGARHLDADGVAELHERRQFSGAGVHFQAALFGDAGIASAGVHAPGAALPCPIAPASDIELK